MNKHHKAVGQFIKMAAIARAGAELNVFVNENLLFHSEHDYAAEFKKKEDVIGLLAKGASEISNTKLTTMFKEIRTFMSDMQEVSSPIKVKVLNTFLRELSIHFVKVAANGVVLPHGTFPVDIKSN